MAIRFSGASSGQASLSFVKIPIVSVPRLEMQELSDPIYLI